MGLLDLLRGKPKVSKVSDMIEKEAYEKEMCIQAAKIGKEKAKAEAEAMIKQNKETIKTKPVSSSKSAFSTFRDYATDFAKNSEEYKNKKPMV